MQAGSADNENNAMTATKRKPPPRMSVGDFLDWAGDGAGGKYQLVDGEVRAMSPASATHGSIQWKLAALIGRHLVDSASSYRGVTKPAVAVRLRADMNLRLPDLGITCAPDTPGQQTLPDPIVLIEVLSPGNEQDTWDNVWAYATIPTVKEILIVHSTRVLAELLRRGTDSAWPAEPEQIEQDGTLRLEAIGFSCALRAVYAQTHLR